MAGSIQEGRVSQQVAKTSSGAIKNCQATTLAMALLLGSPSVSGAEYLIYLKGGHFIVADDCTFSTGRATGKGSEPGEQSIAVDELTTSFVKNCTTGKPDGPIYWSTIDGSFGEVNPDDIYAIFGTKSASIKPAGTTRPLEDYLVTNRGQSFVNSRDVPEEKGLEIHVQKRDELIKIDRRSIIEISPERLAISRSGEGLCSGEPIEFAIRGIELVEGHLVGTVTNLSKEPWRPWIDLEVRVKGRFLGKFDLEDRNVLGPDESGSLDSVVPARFLKELERLTDSEAGVRLCYRKVKTAAKGPTAEPPSAMRAPQ